MNKKNIDKLLESLFAKTRLGIKPGLERSRILDQEISFPHKYYKNIHIAGTNGKGTVASILTSYLMEKGFKVGLYTSPHLNIFNERIRVNGEMISDDEIISIYELIEDKSEEIGATFFEITSTIAFQHFKNSGVDYAVIETGMGGRFDSTNIITPELSIITSISMDHEEYLGSSIKNIAKEKAGIIKKNGHCIYSATDTEVRYEIESIALKQDATTFNIVNSTEFHSHSRNGRLSFIINGVVINTPFIGKYQMENISIVLQTINRLFDGIDENILNKSLAKLKENTGYSSRIELISNEPIILRDVGHNPAAFQSLKDTISEAFPNQNFNIVFGVMHDKNIDDMIRIIKPICKKLILTQVGNERSMKVEILEEIAKKNRIDYISFKNSKEAYDYALELNEATLVCGSFYLIGEIFSD